MALTAPNLEKDWSAPATRGDLFEVEGNLEGKIKDLRVEVAESNRKLSGEMAGLRVEVAESNQKLSGEMAGMDRRLSGEMSRLDSKIDDVRVEMAGLKVFIVWMVVGVITVLGGLVTVFEFIS